MGSSVSRPGRALNGWGVSIRLPGDSRWRYLFEPGRGPDPKDPLDRGTPLCCNLAGARAWAEEYIQKGCEAVLVEMRGPRRPSYRKRQAATSIEKKTESLF